MRSVRRRGERTALSLDKTQMLFGDAKAVIGEVVDESTRLLAAAAVA
jgi:hypothetical protein